MHGEVWRRGIRIGILVLIAFGEPTLSQERSEKPNLAIVRDGIATGIAQREPVGAASVFPPSVGQLYYFTEVRGATSPTSITHVWYYKGQKVAEVPLPVEAPQWRTWSQKQIPRDWIGPWKVEAVGPGGEILASETFDTH
jgi:hypothetical protein